MIKDFIRYVFSDISVRLLGFLSIPIYTFYLSPEDYGVYATIMAYVSISAIVLNLNAHASIGRYLYEENYNIKQFLATTINFSIIILFFSFSMIFLLVKLDFVNKIFSFDFNIYGLYYLFFIVFNIFYTMYIQLLIPLKKSKEFSLLNISNSYFTFFSIMIFLNLFESNSINFIRGIFFSQIVVLAYIFYRLSNYYSFLIKKRYLYYILHYSIFLIPYSLSAILLAQIDRIMLDKMLNSYYVGIYSISYLLGTLPSMFYSSISNAWTPKYFEYMNNKKYDLIFKDIKIILYSITFIIFTILLFSNEIIYLLLDQKYYKVLDILPIFLSTSFFIILWDIWAKGIIYEKKTMWISLIGLVSSILNVILNYLFIEKYKLFGAAYATLISYLFMSFLGYFIAKYYLKVFTNSISDLKYIFFINILIFILSNFDYSFLKYIKIIYFLFIIYFLRKYNEIIFQYIKTMKGNKTYE